MIALLRTVHVLSLAVWLGSMVFFTIAGVLLFGAFAEVSRLPREGKRLEEGGEKRPLWFPLPPEFEKDSPGEGFPEPLRLEQGSRAAGHAVGKMFPVYFGLQIVCAALAAVTALGLLLIQGGGFDKARLAVCVLGLAAVGAGWALERHVHQLRGPRNDLTEAVLKADAPTAELVREARQARADFGKWHGISLMVNFATLGLALTATLLAAHYPLASPPPSDQARTAMA